MDLIRVYSACVILLYQEKDEGSLQLECVIWYYATFTPCHLKFKYVSRQTEH